MKKARKAEDKINETTATKPKEEISIFEQIQRIANQQRSTSETLFYNNSTTEDRQEEEEEQSRFRF